VDPVLIPDVPDPQAELADRMLEVIDQLGAVEGWSGERQL
jgi:hypothetical protein